MKKYLITLLFCFFHLILCSMNQKITLPCKEVLENEFKTLVSYHHIKVARIIEEFSGKEMFPICVVSNLPSYLLRYYQDLLNNETIDELNITLTVCHLNKSVNLIKRILLKDHPDIIKEFEEKGAIEVEE